MRQDVRRQPARPGAKVAARGLGQRVAEHVRGRSRTDAALTAYFDALGIP
jgi:hypothetical protein